MNFVIIILAQISTWIIQTFFHRSASTWPGHIALKLHKNFIQDILKSNPTKIIFIAGTNGKTTTSTMLRHVLEKNNFRVFQNEEGANLLNGIASCLIKNVSITGKLHYDVGIFEVDENVLPLLLKQSKPHAIIILNLFRDQLDRYGEVNSIALSWVSEFKHLTSQTLLFLNGDDPQIYFLGKNIQANVNYYGLSEKFLTQKEIPHDVDSVYCPICGEKLTYKTMSYSHLGDFACPKCDFKRRNVETFAMQEINYPLLGMYNVYNTHAVLLSVVKAFDIPLEQAITSLQDFKAAYGRQERFVYKNRNITILLSKNPTGFNQSIELIKSHFKEKEITALIILNDRIPDGRDVSWIWDVEYEDLAKHAKKIVISGDRTYDMAIRIRNTFEQETQLQEKKYGIQFDFVTVQEDLYKAIDQAVMQTEHQGDLVILPTYSAMLETREILVGRKIM